jgi:hypothetical protein
VLFDPISDFRAAFRAVAPMCAEEGMWTFDNPPLKQLAEKYNFHPRRNDQEMKSPDLEVNVLVGMQDVTARVQGAAKGMPDDAKALKARDAEIAAIEKESKDKTGLRSDVVTRSTRAANTGSINTRHTPTCAWFSRPSSRRRSSAAIRITSPIRATTWTWPVPRV